MSLFKSLTKSLKNISLLKIAVLLLALLIICSLMNISLMPQLIEGFNYSSEQSWRGDYTGAQEFMRNYIMFLKNDIKVFYDYQKGVDRGEITNTTMLLNRSKFMPRFANNYRPRPDNPTSSGVQGFTLKMDEFIENQSFLPLGITTIDGIIELYLTHILLGNYNTTKLGMNYLEWRAGQGDEIAFDASLDERYDSPGDAIRADGSGSSQPQGLDVTWNAIPHLEPPDRPGSPASGSYQAQDEEKMAGNWKNLFQHIIFNNNRTNHSFLFWARVMECDRFIEGGGCGYYNGSPVAGFGNFSLEPVVRPSPPTSPLVADVDCLGSWSTCTEACERADQRIWTETASQSGRGRACPPARNCLPGDDACPRNIDCAGSWSTCGADCADKTYTVTIRQSGEGVECEAEDGATETCSAGEGDCPVPVDCQGSWSTCDESCNKVYSVDTPAVGTGAACDFSDDETAFCNVGEGYCGQLGEIQVIINQYGNSGSTGVTGDVNSDGVVNVEDILYELANP